MAASAHTWRDEAPFCYSDKDLAERYRVSRMTIWRWTRAGKLPDPVKFGDNTTRWLARDVHESEARTLGGAA